MRPARRAPLPLPLIALAAVVLLPLLAGLAVLGPQRALPIATAAVSNVLIDGLNAAPPPHRIPVVELEVAPAALDSLGADLPWSGGEAVPATVLDKGIRYPARFRYRGVYATTHFLGGKRSFRLVLKKDNPFAPYRRLNFINPKAFNMVNDHLALWIATRMGVPVPYDDLAFVRINGRDIGVMEVVEQVAPDFERNRHLTKGTVAVFKGDFPPVTGRALPKPTMLWADPSHWAYEGGGDSAAAHQRLAALVNVVRSRKLTTDAKRDSLPTLIDIDAFLRYYAALKVLNTRHIDDHHNQWLVMSPRTGLFYPVLWDALMMYPHPGEPLHPVHDALSRLVLGRPEWRLQHDRYVREAIEGLLDEGAWTRKVEAVADRLEPSVLRDRNKYGQVSPEPADVHRFSFAHWTHSLATLHDASKAYWERVRTALKDVRADAVVHGNTVQVTLGGENAVLVSVQGDSLVGGPEVAGASATITRTGEGHVHVTLMPRLLPPDSAHAGLHAPPRPAVVTITLPDGVVRSASIHPAE